MRRMTSLLLAALMLMVVLAVGCAKKEEPSSDTVDQSNLPGKAMLNAPQKK